MLAAVVGMGLATAADMRWMLFNSDILLPADFVHRLLLDPGAALDSFQLPRVPSLVPDLLVYALLSLVLPGWRLPGLAYAGVSAAGLTLLCGAMTAGLSGRRFGRSVAVFGAVALLALLADLQFDHAWGAYDLVLFPVIHSGSLLCTFAGLLLVRRFLVRRFLGRRNAGWAAALVLLCGAATLSDRLFLLTFVVPALAGSLAGGSRGLDGRGFVLVLTCVAAGCLAGFAADRVLFNAHALLRQPDVPLDPAVMLDRLPKLLREPSLLLQAGFVLVVVLLPARWAWQNADTRFWWAASAAGSVALLAALPLIYIDWTSTRYMQPVWWWAPVAVAAALVRAGPGPVPWAAATVAGLALVATTAGRGDLFRVHAVTHWRPPLLSCLLDLRARGEVHAGIAGYWVARPLAASSEWTLPVVQVLGNGRPHFWGNDLASYTRGPGGAPPFDFVVMDELEPDSILAFLGTPARRVACNTSEVWLYPQDGRLGARLAAVEPRTRRLDAAAAFGPDTLATRGGRLPPGGAVPPAVGIASWGPYAPLSPGRWRAVVRYDLDGSAVPHGWEVFAAPGGPVLAEAPLQPGHGRTASVLFEMPEEHGPEEHGLEEHRPEESHLVEIRTFTGPDNRLVLPGVGLCPARLDEAACTAATLPPP